jgi:hypothetical protein
MNTTDTAPFTHTADCDLLAMGCAVENFRDSLAEHGNLGTFGVETLEPVDVIRDIIAAAHSYQVTQTMTCPTGKDGCAKLALQRNMTELTSLRRQLRHAYNHDTQLRILELQEQRAAIRNLIGA